uniref:Uncharacterized protein n=1 Tax=Rhizophora mucronata TaxID=61149 RepID=A0A2P2R2X1_RHIMU
MLGHEADAICFHCGMKTSPHRRDALSLIFS